MWFTDNSLVRGTVESPLLDNRLIQTRCWTDSFLCPWGKPLHFLYIQPALYGHPLKWKTDTCFLPNQRSDSHRKSISLMWTLHRDTSLFTVCSNRPFLCKGKKSLTACRCPQCSGTSDKKICRRQFQSIVESNEFHRDRFSISNIDDWFLSVFLHLVLYEG